MKHRTIKSPPNFLNINEIAPLLGNISPQGIYKILKKESIDSVLINRKKRVVTPSGVRKLLNNRGFKHSKKIISLDMIKGGVGKTTISATLGIRASHYGCKTLLIDFDLQGNLTRSFNLPSDEFFVWLNVIKGEKKIEECIVGVNEYLDIIPSNLNNSRLDIEISSANLNIKDLVRDILDPIKNKYDLIIIDCPPAINKVSASAICASDHIIIPLTPDPYAMDGLTMTINEIRRLKKAFKLHDLSFFTVWNKYDARKRLGAIYMHDLLKDFSADLVLPVVIRTDSNYENAIANANSIFEIPKAISAKEDIDQLAKEILSINSWIESNRHG
jgi:chromosome partitioning protein